MASQCKFIYFFKKYPNFFLVAIEFTLEQPAACIFTQPGASAGAQPSYGVTNFNLIPEILEFDSSYDAMFLKGKLYIINNL